MSWRWKAEMERGCRHSQPRPHSATFRRLRLLGGRALRANTKRRGAPFTKARITRDAKATEPVVDAQKRFAPLSKGRERHGDSERASTNLQICTNLIQISEIRVNSWTETRNGMGREWHGDKTPAGCPQICFSFVEERRKRFHRGGDSPSRSVKNNVALYFWRTPSF